jgi:SAM-dependent methyltransferase
MSVPDELPLRCLQATSWPRPDGDLALLRSALRRWLPQGGGAVGWRDGELEEDELLRRAALIRRAGGVAALVVAADAVNPARLRRMDMGVPLLIALVPAANQPLTAWQRAVAAIAACRSATLRFAACDVAPCHRTSSHLDLAARLLAGPSDLEHAVACGPCAALERCSGPGSSPALDEDVRPLPRPLSNQFDLIEQGEGRLLPAALAAGDGCPLEAGIEALAGPRRSVWVAVSDRLRAFRVDSEGWAPDEVERTMDQQGQLYLDVSSKARLDDFASDLRALVRDHAPHQWHGRSCPGLWRVAAEQPFAAEEEGLLSELARLRGTVVDVGAGPLRYVGTLAPAIADGSLRYVAVEPDLPVLARSAAGLPGGLFVRGVGETLPLADASVDAVMWLRSYNHMRDLHRAIGEAARVLRPGGTLLLVDNVTFGLARTPAQLARARGISLQATPFEHYRDHNADDAVVALGSVGGFEIEHSVPVAVGRSNQWLVRARRRAVPKSGHPG